MKFASPLRRGTLVSRYKRFFADVRLDGGQTVTAHCPNPGAMLGLAEPGLEAWVSESPDPKRKLRFTLEAVGVDGALVGINTMHPNRIVREALRADAIPGLSHYPHIRAEVPYGDRHRVDFLLEGADGPRCYLEVKNVHLQRSPRLAEFPDCVTARGSRHLAALGEMVAEGHRAVMLYVVQRTDCDRFALAADLDPTYAAAVAVAQARGVEMLCYACCVAVEGIVLDRPLPILA